MLLCVLARVGPALTYIGLEGCRDLEVNSHHPSMDAVAQKLVNFIQREVSKDPRRPILLSTPLVSSGMVDSFSLIKVLAFIEDELGVVIPDEAATAEAMDSVELILQLVRRFSVERPDG